MSYAQAGALRTHLQTLADSNSPMGAYPDAGDLVSTWGATEWTIHTLVWMVRQGCPDGYIVPFVSSATEMRVIMVRHDGILLHRAAESVIYDLRYCRTRLARVKHNLATLQAGIPRSRAAFNVLTGVVAALESITNSTMGTLSVAIREIPKLVTRANVAERAHLVEVARQVTAV